ncbi:hypothetical protein GQ42DRAFT_172953 [Ramicandelaber brevisporus]|nr:hypothetical protein GQ42DRAFT_172953 [Ramicandelaber brevisporus]
MSDLNCQLKNNITLINCATKEGEGIEICPATSTADHTMKHLILFELPRELAELVAMFIVKDEAAQLLRVNREFNDLLLPYIWRDLPRLMLDEPPPAGVFRRHGHLNRHLSSYAIGVLQRLQVNIPAVFSKVVTIQFNVDCLHRIQFQDMIFLWFVELIIAEDSSSETFDCAIALIVQSSSIEHVTITIEKLTSPILDIVCGGIQSLQQDQEQKQLGVTRINVNVAADYRWTLETPIPQVIVPYLTEFHGMYENIQECRLDQNKLLFGQGGISSYSRAIDDNHVFKKLATLSIDVCCCSQPLDYSNWSHLYFPALRSIKLSYNVNTENAPICLQSSGHRAHLPRLVSLTMDNIAVNMTSSLDGAFPLQYLSLTGVDISDVSLLSTIARLKYLQCFTFSNVPEFFRLEEVLEMVYSCNNDIRVKELVIDSMEADYEVSLLTDCFKKLKRLAVITLKGVSKRYPEVVTRHHYAIQHPSLRYSSNGGLSTYGAKL